MNDKCCFCNKDKCGSFTKLRIPIDGLFSKNDLVNDVENHLSIIKTEKKSFSINLLTEKGLIGNRIGKEFQDGVRICAKHHYKMRIYWRVPLKCQHPDHSRQSKGTLQIIPYNLLVYISSKYNRKLPVGTICTAT